MQDIQVKTINIEGKTYFLLDTIPNHQNTYHFFAELTDPNHLQVLKDKHEKEETAYVSLDTESEFDYALSLLYDKYHPKDKTSPILN